MTIECLTEKVTLRDGTSLVVSEENWLTGVKLLRLQKAADDAAEKHSELEREYFRVYTYPKLCAAIIEGEPPTESESIMMPASELGKWYDAVKKLNPHWFPESNDEKSDESKEKKVKPRKRK